MAVPKRRTSKMKQRTRAASKRWSKPLLKDCPECGSKVPGHIACPSCGYYRKQQVLNVDI